LVDLCCFMFYILIYFINFSVTCIDFFCHCKLNSYSCFFCSFFCLLYMYIVCSPNVHYRLHKSLPVFPNLSQMNSFHVPLYLFKAYFSIILTSMHRPSKLSPSFRVSLQNLYEFILYACYMPCQSIFFRVNIVAIFGE
jgi:hypothetical protein